MKIITFLTCVVLTYQTSIAQNLTFEILGDTLTYIEKFDRVFPINPEIIPSGILYDRVYPTAALTEIDPCDTVTKELLVQSWWELENATLFEDFSRTFPALEKQLFNSDLKDEVALVHIDMSFHKLDTRSLDSGWISFEHNQYSIIQVEKALVHSQVTLSGISRESFDQDSNYTIRFDAACRLTNKESNPTHFIIYLNGLPHQTVDFNSTATLSFSEIGDHLLEIEAINDQGQSMSCNKQMISVLAKRVLGKRSCDPRDILLVESDIPFRGHLETVATTSIADAHVFHHTTPGQDCKIIKPVIIVDGFDPLDQRKLFEIHDIMTYDRRANKNLIDELNTLGFDVVVLNFPQLGSAQTNFKSEVQAFDDNGKSLGLIDLKGRDGGADFIERNAFLLVKLIQMINSELRLNGSDEELIVVGPSMGAMISRFALAFMEKEHANGTPNMDHNTKLWLSFDGPHQGAHISLGAQVTLDFFGVQKGDQNIKTKFYKMLRSVAARQLLVKQYNSLFDHSTQFDSEIYRTKFEQNLSTNGLSGSNGYPINVRKVSLVNGSLQGINNSIPGSADVNIKAYKLGFEVFKWVSRFEYQPKNSITEIFEGKYRTSLGLAGSELTVSLKNNSQNGSHDACQGSYYVDPQNILTYLHKSLGENGIKKEHIQASGGDLSFTFVPTYSALDLNISNSDYHENVIDRVTPCNGTTPFDNYFIPAANEPHIWLTTKNAQWVIQEMQKATKSCPKICVEKDDWPEFVCNGTKSSLKLKNVSASHSGYFWSSNNSRLSFEHSNNRNPGIVEANTFNTDKIATQVSATFYNPCGANHVITQAIAIPAVHIGIVGQSEICAYRLAEYESRSNSALKNYTWYFGDSKGTYKSSSPYTDIIFPSTIEPSSPYLPSTSSFGGSRKGEFKLYTEADNVCGERIKGMKLIKIVEPNSTCTQEQKKKEQLSESETIDIYPNPTQERLVVNLMNDHLAQDVELSIISATGEKLNPTYSVVSSKRLILNLANYSSGLYLLQIEYPDEQLSYHRIIKN